MTSLNNTPDNTPDSTPDSSPNDIPAGSPSIAAHPDVHASADSEPDTAAYGTSSTSTTPTGTAPTDAAPAPQPAAPAAAASAPRRRPLFSTMLWGALMLALAAFVAARELVPGELDLVTWLLTAVVGIGLLLVVAGIAAASRRAG
ncbi:hypothetical protein [Cryobacterium arcticum]|uniref:Uncharacterized protein n=1 Tax=Cryobacterium arcticum TaxID=670052 RepID=A0A1B1BIE9_9MICO|nr:hypothetical protein [Cryobacterium arcticum]ANP72362.1 hypothetical protein PA27867_1405 [Cryobacterium arcticum]